MKRGQAQRRHRRLVVVIAALSAVILLLLIVVAPRLESTFAARGAALPAPTRLVIEAGRFASGRAMMVTTLTAVLIGALWFAFEAFDGSKRRGGRDADAGR